MGGTVHIGYNSYILICMSVLWAPILQSAAIRTLEAIQEAIRTSAKPSLNVTIVLLWRLLRQDNARELLAHVVLVVRACGVCVRVRALSVTLVVFNSFEHSILY